MLPKFLINVEYEYEHFHVVMDILGFIYPFKQSISPSILHLFMGHLMLCTSNTVILFSVSDTWGNPQKFLDLKIRAMNRQNGSFYKPEKNARCAEKSEILKNFNWKAKLHVNKNGTYTFKK